MRERQGLEDNTRAIRGLSQALDDNVGLIAVLWSLCRGSVRSG